MKRTRAKVRLYDAVAILEGGGQPTLEHNAHALKYAASLLRKGEVQTSDAALWATEGRFAKANWPPPRLKLWKRALSAYMDTTPEFAYREAINTRRRSEMQDRVRKILSENRGGRMKSIAERVRKILKQGGYAGQIADKIAGGKYLSTTGIGELTKAKFLTDVAEQNIRHILETQEGTKVDYINIAKDWQIEPIEDGYDFEMYSGAHVAFGDGSELGINFSMEGWYDKGRDIYDCDNLYITEFR